MKKILKKYPNVQLAIFVCLLAVVVGAAAGLMNGGRSKPETNRDFSRVSVKWSVEEEPEPLPDEADVRVFDVADERTTAAATTASAKIPDEKPFSGDFALPMGKDIIKDFSDGKPVKSETMGDWRVHNGVDFAGSAGNDAIAVSNGTVAKVYDDVFWGTVVELDCGNGMVARYCGLKSGSCAAEGAKVKKCDKIGTLGHIPAEISDEDHLHFEILIDGEPVDPLKALNKTGALE